MLFSLTFCALQRKKINLLSFFTYFSFHVDQSLGFIKDRLVFLELFPFLSMLPNYKGKQEGPPMTVFSGDSLVVTVQLL
jgi:hypothetical protein